MGRGVLMNEYIAYEFDENWNPTGRELLFLADTIGDAVGHCLYTARLHNGHAFIGPSGRVVHDGKLAYSIVCG